MQQHNHKSMLVWLNHNRDMFIEALRICLGIGLMLKAIAFINNNALAQEYLNQLSIPVFKFLSVHVIIIIHLIGGFLLAIGLLTRVAALIQIPILLGAVLFIHWRQGLFTQVQNLEYVLLVLLLLIVFVGYGGGRLSVDYYLARRKKRSHSL